MSFVPLILLAAIAFAVAVLVLRLPKSGWTLLGAALLFGLTGYAVQGSPGQAGAPKVAEAALASEGESLVEARRALFGPVPESSFVTVSDGFARRGQFGDAAGILNGAIARTPDDPEAWLALGIALVEHAEGQITPAAIYAFGRAEQLAPGNPGPGLFFGAALIRAGRPVEARELWARMLESAPADAPWRAGMRERIDRLDALIAQAGGQPPVSVPQP